MVARVLVLLAIVALATANVHRVYRDDSNDVAPGINPNAPGRRIPFKIVEQDGRRVRLSPCLTPDALSPQDRMVCKNMRIRQNKHDRVQKRLNKIQQTAGAAPTAPPMTGFLVNAQWDGETAPKILWSLEITRQSTLEYPGVPDEVQLQVLIPQRTGAANGPTYSAYDPITRNYYMTVKMSDTFGYIFGSNIAGDVNSSTQIYPQQTFQFPYARANMIGMETVSLGGQQIVLVFYDNGFVSKVDPATGATSPYTQLCNSSRVANAVTYRKDTHEIFVLTESPQGIGRRPDYGIITFNYATKLSNEVLMQVPAYFNPLDESGFELVWIESVQNLMVFFTGLFDQVIYVNPYTSAATFAYGNLAEFQGSNGNIEFTSDTFLQDLDTDANVAVDDGPGQTIYFQCSDVDPNTGMVTTTLCSHEMPTDLKALTWLNINIEPMTYGYAAMEFVQIDA